MKDEKTEPIIAGQAGYKTGKVRYSFAYPRSHLAMNMNVAPAQPIKHATPFSAFLRYEKDKEKAEQGVTQPDPVKGIPKASQSNYGNYLFGVGYEDPSDVDGDAPTNWTSYTPGRFGIRLFSRGIMGAAFFTMASRATGRLLNGYNHMEGFTSQRNGLQMVSKAFDTVLAKPIQSVARAIAPAASKEEYAHRIVWFRDKAEFGSRIFDASGKSIATDGRSLGAEMSAITFDFAMASVGDAWGRQIASLFDPNQKISWYQDKQFDAKQFTRSVAWNAWDIFSLRQAEDWAAALPYVYQMRFQRQALNKLYPGFKLTADKALNGAAWQFNEHGDISASYAKAGMLDLQFRFTGYNWYTLMYRDLYRNVSDAIQSYHDHGNTLPKLQMPDDPLRVTMDSVADTFRYVTKSAIKASIYMMPSVPFFWIFRVPQTKYKGMGVVIPTDGDRSKGGYLLMPDGKSEFTYPRTGESFAGEGVSGYQRLDGSGQMRVGSVRRSHPMQSQVFQKEFYPFDRAHVRGAFDAALNPLGEACYKGGELLDRGFKSMGIRNQRMFAHDYVNAAMSYTPYMFAKTEAALRWDREGMNRVNYMDNAIYRLIDGVTSLNLNEVRGGVADIREQIIHPEVNAGIKVIEQSQNKENSPENTSRPTTKVAAVSHDAQRLSAAHSHHLQGDSEDKHSKPEGKWAHKHHVKPDTAIPPNVTIH